MTALWPISGRLCAVLTSSALTSVNNNPSCNNTCKYCIYRGTIQQACETTRATAS